MMFDRIRFHRSKPPRTFNSDRSVHLRAGAAAGGGLLLSMSLPFAGDEAETVRSESFEPMSRWSPARPRNL